MTNKTNIFAGLYTVSLFLYVSQLISSVVYVYWYIYPHSNASLREQAGVCVKRNLGLSSETSFSALEFQPSDLDIDRERGLLMIVSLDDVTAIPAGLPTDEVASMKSLYRFSEGTEELEAIKMINGTIYLISESKKNTIGDPIQSDIIALNYSDGMLHYTNRWRIDTPNAEGMAYIPNWFQNPTLMVSGDRGNTNHPKQRLDLQAFRMPFGSKPLTQRLNQNFFVTADTLDSKVASMEFFHGCLYMLFDNDKYIRAFASDGSMVNQWPLPSVGSSFDKQWEGMCLQQNGNELYLHLALDTPPEIWTLKLQGNTSPNAGCGEWKFPSCAS